MTPAVVPRRFLRLLSMGAKFIPANPNFVTQQLPKSLEKFELALRWTQIFGWPNTSSKYPLFRPKSKATPPPLSPENFKYFSSVQERFKPFLASRHRPSFFDKEISSFQSWAGKNFVIKVADKNLGLVVMTIDTYNRLCFDYLDENCDLCVESESDTTRRLSGSIADILGFAEATGCVSRNVSTWMRECESSYTRLSPFYILPKLHKFPIASRPIVAAHSAPFTSLSLWLSKVLHPVVARLPAFLKDSRELIQLLLKTTFSPDVDLVCFDVVSMYPSMRLDRCLTGVRYALKRAYPSGAPKWSTLVLQIMEQLFNNTFFIFEGKVFKQRNGIAMGTPAAPDLANAYLSDIEESFVKDPNILFYKRFIDDGLCIVTHGYAPKVLEALAVSGLSFTHTISSSCAVFLDLEVFKGPLFYSTGMLSFKTFHKSMNRFLYLPAFSSHHPTTIRSWIAGEIVRLRNTCLSDEDFSRVVSFFLKNLRRRNYSKQIILDALERLPTLLSPLSRSWPSSTLPPLVNETGEAFAVSPPMIFRAPFSLHMNIPYGEILHSNLNPEHHHNITVANTAPSSLAKRIIKAFGPKLKQ